MLFLLLLALSAVAGAQEACPWLTRGTAAALMGGDVTASVHVAAGEGTCEFSRVAGTAGSAASAAASLRMRITVGHLPAKECATGERLTGIGQDALFCTTDAAREHRAIIRGRVRETYFLLTLTAEEPGAAGKSLRRSLEQAAEEVAGSLF